MRAERHAFLGDLAEFAEAEDLKPARVGEDRAPPGHESMQPAELSHSFNPRPQVEVVRIAEDDLRAQFFERILGYAFHGRQSPHGHKHRGCDFCMRRQKASGAGFASDRVDVERDGHRLGL